MPNKSVEAVVWKPVVLTPIGPLMGAERPRKTLPRQSLQTLKTAVQEAAGSTRPRQLLAPGSSSSQEEGSSRLQEGTIPLTDLRRYASPPESAKAKHDREMSAWLEEEISSGRWDLQWESDPVGRYSVVGKREDGKGKGKAS